MATFLFISFVLYFVFLKIIISSYELNHSTANDNITINISREINFVKKREILVNKWGNWTLPIKYYISSKYMLYSENIQNALNNIQNLTCLNFTKADKLDPGEEGLKFVHDYGICGSYVGKSSYSFPHVVYLTTGCSETIGSIQHEIFHALGVQHTHSRSDRDKYIEIKKENFLEYEDFEENILEKNNKNNYKSYNTLYDFNSILHYKNNAWSKNGKKTIVAKSIKLYDNMMGQREKLSFMDVKLINGYYCNDKCKENVIKCKNGGYKHWSNCNICVCPKGYVGNTCNSVEPLDRECSNINLKAQNFYKKIHVTGIKKCNFLIKAKGNKKILLLFTVVTQPKDICTPESGVEIKYMKDKAIAGLCLCGFYKRVYIKSEGSDVYIEYNGKRFDNQLVLFYALSRNNENSPGICHRGNCFKKVGNRFEKFTSIPNGNVKQPKKKTSS